MRLPRRNIIRALASIGVAGPGLSSSTRGAEVSAIPRAKRVEFEAHLAAILHGFPDEQSERVRLVDRIASDTCRTISETLPDVDLDDIATEAIIADSTLGVLKNVFENLSEALRVELPIKYLEYASKLTKFLPLVSSVQNYLEINCEIFSLDAIEDVEEKLEEFYIATLLVVFELLLLPSSVGYRSAFVGTRYVANIGLVRLRSLVGLRLYSILLSVVHWGIRGTIEGAIGYIVERTTHIVENITIPTADVEFEPVEKSDLDFAFLREDRQDGLLDFLDSEDDRDKVLSEIDVRASRWRAIVSDETTRLGEQAEDAIRDGINDSESSNGWYLPFGL